ncbi:MAG: endolytic transglycosylase MltG [Candidatus Paceibacterota bacterium]|jgi:UPF0755 protein
MNPKKYLKSSYLSVCAGLCAFLAIIFLFVIYFSIAPSDFPQKEIVTIEKGMYLSQAADLLEEKHIIKSAFLFKVFTVLVSGNRYVLAGDYLFDSPQSVLKVASRLANGVQGLAKIKITILEGMTAKDISLVLEKNIPNFDKESFFKLAKPYEGYLFPDTYYFYENTKPDEVIVVLRTTFDRKEDTIYSAILKFDKPEADVIKMASIVEKEATSSIDRRIIAGVLWKRIEMGMPLQVDPPFYYLLGKDSSEITKEDLALDSPYNTYLHKGLPPTPINNPGLDAILDTITPTTTKYLFYLSDKKGNMHYAATYEGHLVNKSKYIK